ncbi:MAG: hypothetical protein J6S74_03610 [Alphaproteobacteria bacterium]|nr:hypothetical protein [Alphaproteobacteria bacterium]
MQNRIEPPILLSRLLTLVFAATLVVLGAMAVTLYNLFPLNRPEVFFLQSADTNNSEITLTQVMPNGDDLERYKREFIKEYIKTRNEITPNVRVMNQNWGMQGGTIKTTSSADIFADFVKTAMYQEFLINNGELDFSCSVEFSPGSVNKYTADGSTYTVDFKWFCTNSYGQTDRKDYRIKITLATDDKKLMRWTDVMENPLGMRVVEYSVESGDGDPLDAFVIGNE